SAARRGPRGHELSASPERPQARLAGLFFFQAEDGIRDFHVTGVQTCALPISTEPSEQDGEQGMDACGIATTLSTTASTTPSPARSEERRVGKECRYRGSACH